uniref:Kelch domain-containing protein 3-like n=2 Tax=Hirondellea gigas TaxID=1518452 RepID=A0A2P2ID27_9CRUS
MSIQWTMKLDKGPCRVNHAAVAVDGKIYSFGGYISGQNYNEHAIPIEVFLLDTRTHRWEQLLLDNSNAPFRRYGHSVVAYGRHIYLWGGRNDDICDERLYCFDTADMKWSTPHVKGEMPLASDGHAAAIYENVMYIHGGYVESIGAFTLKLYALNLNTFVWTLLPQEGQYPRHRDFHTMSVTPDGNLLVFGGREMAQALYTGADAESYPNNLHMYDTRRQCWSKLVCEGMQPVGRRSHSAFVYKWKLYIFAGFNSRLNSHMNDLYSLDIKSNTWLQHNVPEVRPFARRRQALCLLDSTIYMFGGTHPDPQASLNPVVPHPHYDDYEQTEQLQELDDLWVLDLSPSLETLSLLTVVRQNQPMDGLPIQLQRRAKYVPRADTRPVSSGVGHTRRS